MNIILTYIPLYGTAATSVVFALKGCFVIVSIINDIDF